MGKTTLISHLARNNATLSTHLVYMQVPDSDERDVAATFQRALKDSDHGLARHVSRQIADFPTMARAPSNKTSTRVRLNRSQTNC